MGLWLPTCPDARAQYARVEAYWIFQGLASQVGTQEA